MSVTRGIDRVALVALLVAAAGPVTVGVQLGRLR